MGPKPEAGNPTPRPRAANPPAAPGFSWFPGGRPTQGGKRVFLFTAPRSGTKSQKMDRKATRRGEGDQMRYVSGMVRRCCPTFHFLFFGRPRRGEGDQMRYVSGMVSSGVVDSFR